ncbi:MAG: hypothetical protein GOV01_00780 [Candidatus Altiarchaeota archaeon]|nr:hypothetical protein [Candidatus Altiarchaeota archaeon]
MGVRSWLSGLKNSDVFNYDFTFSRQEPLEASDDKKSHNFMPRGISDYSNTLFFSTSKLAKAINNKESDEGRYNRALNYLSFRGKNPELIGRISDTIVKSGDPDFKYEELVESAARPLSRENKRDANKYAVAIKEIAREIITKGMKRQELFGDFYKQAEGEEIEFDREKFDAAYDVSRPDAVRKLYTDVFEKVKPLDSYSGDVNTGFKTALWTLFFPLVGIAKAAYHPAKFAAEKIHQKGIGKPDATDLLELKRVGTYFHETYETFLTSMKYIKP